MSGERLRAAGEGSRVGARPAWALSSACVSGLRVLARAALIAGVLGGAACQSTVTEASDARPMPARPVAPPPVPPDAQVNAMTFVLLTPKGRDTTGNGRADLIQVEAYLFSQPFPSPVFAPGEFVFEMFPLGTVGNQGATAIAAWRFAGETADAARVMSLAGAAYRFSLSLLDTGTDALPFNAATVTARFEPAGGGTTVSAGGVVTVQLRLDGRTNG